LPPKEALHINYDLTSYFQSVCNDLDAALLRKGLPPLEIPAQCIEVNAT